MTVIQYHGGPITPETCAHRTWAGRHAFISFAEPRQVKLAASICQTIALDNGAYSFWRSGTVVDLEEYYEWADYWLRHPSCDWAVIPDVIGGTEDENDALIEKWPLGARGVPVWHLNESVERLVRLARDWPRVALGSAEEFDVQVPTKCLARLFEVLPAICDLHGFPTTKLHGLRMLNPYIVTKVPLASADSTNVARNIKFDKAWNGGYAPSTKETRALVLAERLEAIQPPHRLSVLPIDLFEEEP